MKSLGVVLLLLVLAGCKDDESDAPNIPTKVVIESVQVDAMPMNDLSGLPWDPNDGPDVFVTIYDKNSNVRTESRTRAVSNVTSGMLPLHIGVNASFAMDTDSCYAVLWDRDDDAGDPDDFIASANERISASRLKQAGNPRSFQMRDTGGNLHLVVYLLYQ